MGGNQSLQQAPQPPMQYRNPIRDNYCLDVNGSGKRDGEKVQMWDCNGGNNQQFRYNPNTLQITALHSNKCLDANNVQNGSIIKQVTCNNNSNQKFTIENETIKPFISQNLCMDVRGGRGDNGTPVQLWECNNTNAQIWKRQ